MKAITIWQPWASLLACGAKKYETRSRPISYRGPIAIHAAARKCDTSSLPASTVHAMIQALRPVTEKQAKTAMYIPLDLLPRGAVIATAELVNCWYIVHHPGTDVDVAKHIPIGAESMTTDKHAPGFADYFVPTDQEILFGDWTPGRYALELANVKMLDKLIPVRGQQGLWNWRGTN